jgi:hypothetical protein
MKRPHRRAPAPVSPRAAATPRRVPNRLLRWCINLCVILHFSAIISAAVIIGPAPGYAQAAWKLFHPYLQALFLNHGFNFFAPEPSPTTLMDFEAVRADGSIVKARIPERSIWPGLLYQRHLLLTEHIGVVPEGFRDGWYRSYARHLCRKYGASKVHLVLLMHFPMDIEEVREGGRLDDPFTYQEMDLGDFSCDGP